MILRRTLRKQFGVNRVVKIRSLQTDPFQLFENNTRSCTLCGVKGRFYSWPEVKIYRCGNCVGSGRHRLLYLYISKRLPETVKNVLQIGPEIATKKIFEEKGIEYIGADLHPGYDWVKKEDLTQLSFPEASFDLFECSHVLEHIPEDQKAIAELHRILKPGGYGLIMVPIIESWEATYENPDINTDEERTVHFGQKDHVRRYGRDFRERLKAPGFRLEEFKASPQECAELDLDWGETLFVVSK